MGLPAPAMPIQTSRPPSAVDAAVNAVRDLDALDQLLTVCTIVQQLSHPHKSFLHCLLESLVDNEGSGQKNGVEYNRDVSKQPLDEVLRRLCLLKPEEAQSVLAMSNIIEELYQQRVMANNGSLFSQYKDMQLQHILSIAALHPAFTEVQQQKFARLAAALASQDGAGYPLVTSSDLPSSPTTSTSPGSSSPLTSSLASLSPQNSLGLSSSPYGGHAPLQSTLSAPPVHRISSGSHLGPRSSLVAEVDYHHRLHRSLSSSPSAHSHGDSEPLSGISDSNGSLINIPDESYVYTPPKAGMRDVPTWLKGLRLHKYCGLLASKSYDELLNVTEAQLEVWNVTKGARNKILQCIQKLHERPDETVKLVKQVNDVGDVRTVLNEVRSLLATPMKLAPRLCLDFAKIQSIEDIPPQDLAARLTFILRKMGNVYCSAAGPIPVEEDCTGPFIQLLDRCMRHEAFYGVLRSTLLAVKQSLQALMRNTTFQGHRKLTKSYTTAPVSSPSAFGPPFSERQGSQNNINRSTEADSFFLPVPDGFSARSSSQQQEQQHRPLHRCFALNKGPVGPPIPNDNSMFLKPKTPLSRARSAPVAPKPLTAAQSNLWFDGVDADLESLTLSVTEHALPSIEQTTF